MGYWLDELYFFRGRQEKAALIMHIVNTFCCKIYNLRQPLAEIPLSTRLDQTATLGNTMNIINMKDFPT